MKRQNLKDLEENGQLGDFAIFINTQGDGELYIGFRSPTPGYAEAFPAGWDPDRGDIHCIPITKAPKQPNSWLWDGNEEEPTISPSIDVVGQWHGYIESGKLRTA